MRSLRGSMPTPGAVHTPPGQSRPPASLHCPLGLPPSGPACPTPHQHPALGQPAARPSPGPRLGSTASARPPPDSPAGLATSFPFLSLPRPRPETLPHDSQDWRPVHLQRPGPVPVTTATAPATPLIRQSTRSGQPAALLPRTAPRSLVPVDSSPAKRHLSWCCFCPRASPSSWPGPDPLPVALMSWNPVQTSRRWGSGTQEMPVRDLGCARLPRAN